MTSLQDDGDYFSSSSMPLYDLSPTLTADNTMQVVATPPGSLILFALTRHALIGDILFSSHVLECPGSFMFSNSVESVGNSVVA